MEQSEDGMLVVEGQSKPYYSLTNVARQYNKESPSYIIQSWLRDRSTLEFLRIWEEDNNPNFRAADYLELLQRTKEGSFTLTPKQWIDKTNAIGIMSKQGKNGGTYAHREIACEFLAWVNPRFRYLIVKAFELTNQVYHRNFMEIWNHNEHDTHD